MHNSSTWMAGVGELQVGGQLRLLSKFQANLSYTATTSIKTNKQTKPLQPINKHKTLQLSFQIKEAPLWCSYNEEVTVEPSRCSCRQVALERARARGVPFLFGSVIYIIPDRITGRSNFDLDLFRILWRGAVAESIP